MKKIVSWCLRKNIESPFSNVTKLDYPQEVKERINVFLDALTRAIWVADVVDSTKRHMSVFWLERNISITVSIINDIMTVYDFAEGKWIPIIRGSGPVCGDNEITYSIEDMRIQKSNKSNPEWFTCSINLSEEFKEFNTMVPLKINDWQKLLDLL